MNYHQSTTEVVAFAWNAETVCRRCARRGLLAMAGLKASVGDVMHVRELVAAKMFPGQDPDLLDTNDFPFPVTAGEEGVMEDSCGQCLTRIEDTL